MEFNLIEAVQMHPCLFDKSIVGYRNKLAKEKAWNNVAAAAGASVEQCQGRWRSLRDRYVKEVNVGKGASGSAAKDISNWKYMDAMTFLQRHVAPRQTIGNTTFIIDEVENQPTPQQTFEEVGFESEVLFEECPVEDSTYEVAQCDQLNNDCRSTSQPLIESQKDVGASSNRSIKRKRDEDRLDQLCGTVSDWLKKSEAPAQQLSRNSQFLSVLDSYLLKHSEEDQDFLKIQILNLAYNGVEN